MMCITWHLLPINLYENNKKTLTGRHRYTDVVNNPGGGAAAVLGNDISVSCRELYNSIGNGQ